MCSCVSIKTQIVSRDSMNNLYYQYQQKKFAALRIRE